MKTFRNWWTIGEVEHEQEMLEKLQMPNVSGVIDTLFDADYQTRTKNLAVNCE